MLEESIDSSPNSLDSSIRRKREHRKTKRRRLNDLLQRPIAMVDQKIRQMYCDDSDQKESVAPVMEQNSFKLFQAENMMANADRFDEPREVRKMIKQTQITQEFWTCERLLETQEQIDEKSDQMPQEQHLDTSFLSCQSVVDNTKVNFDAAWIPEGFEDDMILQTNDCQVNEMNGNSVLDKTLVPNTCDKTILESAAHWEHNIDENAFVDWSPTEHVKRKTIVETILEDFCTSIDSTDSMELDSNNFMPFFRFRRKKIRTYERYWRLNTNSAGRNVAETYKVDEDGLSDGSDSSSELSVQEDKSQVQPKVEPLEHLNTSSRIRSNLLNLSAFFTQNLIDSDDAEESDQTAFEAVNDTDIVAVGVSGYEAIKQLVMEILTLRAKYPISYEFVTTSGNKDFHGFPSNEENTDDRGDANTAHGSGNIVCRSAPTLLQSCTSTAQHLESSNTKNTVLSNKHQNSFDEDSWHHDSDFFANFQTQAVIKAENTEIAKTRRKSDSTLTLTTQKRMRKQSTERKTLIEETICLPSKLKTQRSIVSNKPTVSVVSHQAIKMETNPVESQIPVEDILKLFENQHYNCTLPEPIEKAETSKVLESDFDCMLLSEWPLDENEFVTKCKKDTNLSYIQPRRQFQNDHSESMPSLPPRIELETLTASSKNEFLIPQCLEENTRTANECTSFEGFQTASRKTIQISEEGRKKAESLFAQLPDLPGEETENGLTDLPNLSAKKFMKEAERLTCFTGFQTASRKAINISEESRKKIDSVFAQLPDLPGEKTDNSNKAERRNTEMPNVPSDKPGIETEKARCFTGFQTASCKAINVTEEARKNIDSIFAQLPDLPTEETVTTSANIKKPENKSAHLSNLHDEKHNKQLEGVTCFTGFQTASCKAINVTEEARKKIDSIFAQLPDLPSEKIEKLSTNKSKADSRSVRVPESPSKIHIKQAENGKCFTGFQTASCKAINVSEEAQKKVDIIFAQLPELPEEKIKNPNSKTMVAKRMPMHLSDSSSENNTAASGLACFTGFQTASRKAINVSEEAQKKIESVFAKLPDLPDEKAEISPRKSVGISSKVIKKSEKNFVLHGKEQKNENLMTKHSDNFEDLTNIPLSEWLPNCESALSKQSADIKIEPNISIKRRLNTIENVNSNEQPNNMLCRSNTMNENLMHTPISSSRYTELKTSLSHVPNSKLIGRRNLLSLTKRRRESLRMESNIKHDTADTIETPVKLLPAVCTPKNILAPQTPQTNEFFAQLPAAASTPQQPCLVNTPVQISKYSTDNLDSDFKRINWENNDDHHVNNELLNATPTRANKSLKPQPSPQERIENLSSCGDPPPLPQLVDSNSRSRNLGMSRCRRRCANTK